MSGGRCLVALREVQSAERILQMKSLAKAGFQFWKMNLQPEEENVDITTILTSISNEILDSQLDKDSTEVCVYVAGFITKKILKHSKCDTCLHLLKGNPVNIGTEYIDLLSRGGLLIPSKPLSSHVCKCFAMLDVAKDQLCLHVAKHVRNAAESVLRLHGDNEKFMCDKHHDWGLTLVNRTIVNICFNNEQVIESNTIKKDEIKSFKVRQIRKRKNDN